MKIVIDTNVLVSGIFWKGVPYRILEMWMEEKIKLVTSPVIIEEYLEVINRINPDYADVWLQLIVENSIVIENINIFNLSRDPDDDKFINCAVFGKAKYLVSGDKDARICTGRNCDSKRIFGFF